MTAIWVLENINKDREYYSKFNILCLFSSVVVYKRNNPNHFTKLYVDDLTYSFIEDLGAIHLWDEVIKFEFDLNVDKSVFWASSKLHILSKVREPVIIIDNDSLVYENLDKYLDNKIIVSNLENGKGYYPLSFDPFIRKLSYKARWQPESPIIRLSLVNPCSPYKSGLLKKCPADIKNSVCLYFLGKSLE